MNTAIIILAAGASSRMGAPKQLLLIDGKTLIKRTFDTAMDTPCHPIVLVLGANRDLIRKETEKMPITVIDNPVKEVLLQLSTGDSLSLVWDDSPQAHFALHTVEDLALDTWDITDGLDVLEISPDDFADMSTNELHDSMMKHLGMFVDLLAAFVAETVMESLSEAVAEHMLDAETKKDISPFKDEE
jgi:hypothetical protein